MWEMARAAQSLSRVQLCNTRDRSTPGLPVLHHRPELSQNHVHESVMPSNHLILCRPLLLPPSIFPSIRVLYNELALLIRWPKYSSFSISPSSEYSRLISFRIDCFDFLAVQGDGCCSSAMEILKSGQMCELARQRHPPKLSPLGTHRKSSCLTPPSLRASPGMFSSLPCCRHRTWVFQGCKESVPSLAHFPGPYCVTSTREVGGVQTSSSSFGGCLLGFFSAGLGAQGSLDPHSRSGRLLFCFLLGCYRERGLPQVPPRRSGHSCCSGTEALPFLPS